MGVKLAEWFQCSEFCQNEGRSRSWFAGCKSRPPDGRQRGLSSVASTNPASLPGLQPANFTQCSIHQIFMYLQFRPPLAAVRGEEED